MWTMLAAFKSLLLLILFTCHFRYQFINGGTCFLLLMSHRNINFHCNEHNFHERMQQAKESDIISCHNTHTHTHPFNGPLSGTTQVSRYQKGKTNLYFTEARDSEWQRHQLGYMQVCTLLQTDNHASTPPLSFLQAGCPPCRPTNSINALKAQSAVITVTYNSLCALSPVCHMQLVKFPFF